MHLIRRATKIATYKLKTRYRYFTRLAKIDKTSWTNLLHGTNLIRFKGDLDGTICRASWRM